MLEAKLARLKAKNEIYVRCLSLSLLMMHV